MIGKGAKPILVGAESRIVTKLTLEEEDEEQQPFERADKLSDLLSALDSIAQENKLKLITMQTQKDPGRNNLVGRSLSLKPSPLKAPALSKSFVTSED